MKKSLSGFTLVELAMVLMIVGLLLGGLIPSISSQVEQQRTKETRRQMEEIQQALIGFAIANGRLPCPASSSSNGVESPAGGNCTNFYNGYVPAATLGIASVNSQGLVVDSWENPIRYAVASNTINSVSNALTSNNGMRTATMDSIAGASLLNICSSATGIYSSTCGATASNKLTDKVPALVFSTGKNGGYGGTGLDEAANLNNDKVFISHTPSPDTATNGEFDDLMIWLSPNILFNRMAAAGKLP
ncbi:MAG: prepilin-type N-terminal cleavage/methylation domain-containing protein [Sideroxydans sp.]|nr:prepilin-type N-terminal cleavage/methylation domain-containing protein [Sideroxydans sp.]